MARLKQIIMDLAREPGHPHGDAQHGYLLHLPLNDEGRIDERQYEQMRDICTVRRFRPGEDPRNGRIRQARLGDWRFDYDDRQEFDDEQGFRLGDERFVPGEYVSIREDDGIMHTFQVISVRPWM
jgi:hypothetical protein